MLSYYEFNWGLEEDHDKGRRSKLIAAATGLGGVTAAGLSYRYLKGKGRRAADAARAAEKGWSTGAKVAAGAAGLGAVGYGIKRLTKAKGLKSELEPSHIKTEEKEGRDLVVAGVKKIKHLDPHNPSREIGTSAYWIGTPEEWERAHEAIKKTTEKEHLSRPFQNNPDDEVIVVHHLKNYKGDIPSNSFPIQKFLKTQPHNIVKREIHPLGRQVNILAHGFQKG